MYVSNLIVDLFLLSTVLLVILLAVLVFLLLYCLTDLSFCCYF